MRGRRLNRADPFHELGTASSPLSTIVGDPGLLSTVQLMTVELDLSAPTLAAQQVVWGQGASPLHAGTYSSKNQDSCCIWCKIKAAGSWKWGLADPWGLVQEQGEHPWGCNWTFIAGVSTGGERG